jgi:hypothetical protein
VAAPSNPDPLLQLVKEREDEMSPSWRALVGLLRFWLGLFGALGPMVVIGVALRVMAEMFMRFGSVGLWSYFVIAMPVSAGLVVGLRRLRVTLARRIADAIRARLAGIGGTLTPASFSLGPRREERR